MLTADRDDAQAASATAEAFHMIMTKCDSKKVAAIFNLSTLLTASGSALTPLSLKLGAPSSGFNLTLTAPSPHISERKLARA